MFLMNPITVTLKLVCLEKTSVPSKRLVKSLFCMIHKM